ncbi:MAG: methyltransferase [Anaerolineae bacterium]|nr:methyltransferase [Phycisphaerae bacterium]
MTTLRAESSSDRQRRKLLARIVKQHEIITREISIGDLRIPFTQIKDPDRVLDDIVAEADRREKVSGVREHEDELHLPYWAELWDSAMGVGQWLVTCWGGEQVAKWGCENSITSPPLHLPTSPSRASVLDLGCGMGLAGTVAAALGHRVLLADIEPDALLFARANAMQFGADVRARRVDWRRDRLNESFDMILGADVLYDKSQWDYLDLFFRAHLRVGGSVILGEPGRQTGEMFITWINGKGWRLEQSEQAVITRPKPIRLFRLFR